MPFLENGLEQHQQIEVDAREISLIQHIGEIIPFYT
jgi:hypothetical protein